MYLFESACTNTCVYVFIVYTKWTDSLSYHIILNYIFFIMSTGGLDMFRNSPSYPYAWSVSSHETVSYAATLHLKKEIRRIVLFWFINKQQIELSSDARLIVAIKLYRTGTREKSVRIRYSDI